MDSVFRNDILQQETSFFLRNTFLLPTFIYGQKYVFDKEDVKSIINHVKEISQIQLTGGHLSFSSGVVTEGFMKRCFSKCKQFVMEDWVDYDELDCTMRCTLLHKKSLNVMKEVNKTI